MDSLRELSRALGVGPDGWPALLGVVVLLGVTTVLRGIQLRRTPGAETRDRWRSLGTWWGLLALLLVVLLLGRPAVALTTAVISLLALREGLRLTGATRLLPPLAAVAIGCYAWVWLDPRSFFLLAVPPLALLLASLELAARFRLSPPLAALRGVGPAVGLTVVGLSFAVGVASFPPPADRPDAALGWFLLLVILTELDDIAQAWWGRLLGSRPLAPRLSPDKTRQGLWGGLATTTLAALLLAPLLTSYGRAPPPGLELPVPPWLWSVLLGVVVTFAGIAGDLSASSLKRRARVEDSGTLLPGHGGVLDRFDSLALTAPAFFLLTHLLWIGPR